jgi:hypothetical protein
MVSFVLVFPASADFWQIFMRSQLLTMKHSERNHRLAVVTVCIYVVPVLLFVTVLGVMVVWNFVFGRRMR